MIKLTMLSGLYFAFITVVLQKLLIRERDYFPDVVCDYRAPDSCDPNNPPLPCCQRPEVTASGVMVVSSLLLMAACNDPCHFAAVDFVFTVQQKPLVIRNKAEILKYSYDFA